MVSLKLSGADHTWRLFAVVVAKTRERFFVGFNACLCCSEEWVRRAQRGDERVGFAKKFAQTFVCFGTLTHQHNFEDCTRQPLALSALLPFILRRPVAAA
jgi:hypothetical protein